MKRLYGPFALLICDLAAILLMWQFYLKETTPYKWIILIIALLLMVIINIKSLITLTKKVNRKLEGDRRQAALKKVRKKKRMANILLSILAICLVAGNYIYSIANKAIDSITLNIEPYEFKAYLVTSKESDIQSASDENLIYLGFSDSSKQYQSLFEETLSNQYEKIAYIHYQPIFETNETLIQKLNNDELHAIMITEDTYNQYKSLHDHLRILDSYTIQTAAKPKSVNVSKEAFNVLILGVDIRQSEGDIHTDTRADTIMVASFNPKTMKASLISIPRDAYVPLSYNDQSDKLTHASLQGVDCMIETVEDLLDIKINYYAKFNFKALVGLVDAMGGIEVDVKFSFTESNSDDVPNSISVTEGLQTLNGEEALAYARHRNTQNDHVRNNSQQEVLKAIISKLASFDTLTKINDLLDVLNTNMSTNFGRNEIMDLVKILPNLSELSFTNSVIEGEDYETYVPKYDEVLWITELSESSLEEAKQMIQDILEGK